MGLTLLFWINDHKESFVQCSLISNTLFEKFVVFNGKWNFQERVVEWWDCRFVWSFEYELRWCLLTYHPSLFRTHQGEWRNWHVGNILFQFQTPQPILKLNRWSYSNAKQLHSSQYMKPCWNFPFIKILDKAYPDSKQLFFWDKII